MVATLFFNAGGTFTVPDSHTLTVSEGVRLEIPCVQSALFFEQKIGGECLVPKNWGIRVSASQVTQNRIAVREKEDDSDDTGSLDGVFSDFEVFDTDEDADFEEFSDDKSQFSLSIPDFSKIGCELSLGRITIGGPVSMLKNPVPGFKKKWSAKTASSMRLKGSLPTAKAAKKPLSALVSLELGNFFAGFAAVGLETAAPDENTVPSLGAESFLVQACFLPGSQKDFTFFLGSTLSVSQFGGTKSNQFFSIKTFRPQDCLVNLLNVGLISKSWGRTTLAVQNSFSAGLSRHKNGIAFCNDALISLSGKGFFVSVGCFCADFGYVTSSGAEIVEPFRAYGSFSVSFKTGGAKIGVNGACATGLSYDEGVPLQLPAGNVSAGGAGNTATGNSAAGSGVSRTSVMCGISVAQGGFSVAVEGSVKNLCPKDDFADAVCNFSLKVGFGDGSLQLNTKTPLFFVDEKPVWAVTLNAGGGKQKKLSGSVSGKFEGFAFSALKGSLSLSCGIVKLSASSSISSAQKLTWSLSAQVKL